VKGPEVAAEETVLPVRVVMGSSRPRLWIPGGGSIRLTHDTITELFALGLRRGPQPRTRTLEGTPSSSAEVSYLVGQTDVGATRGIRAIGDALEVVLAGVRAQLDEPNRDVPAGQPDPVAPLPSNDRAPATDPKKVRQPTGVGRDWERLSRETPAGANWPPVMARVELAPGATVAFEFDGEEPDVLDLETVTGLFRAGLQAAPRWSRGKPDGSARLVLDGGARFQVGTWDLGRKRGMKVVLRGLAYILDVVVKDTPTPVRGDRDDG
jgi:hypothetical protein